MLLPQLDLSYYPSQIFWFAISFCIVFFGVRRYLLPLYLEIVSKRYASLGQEIQTTIELQQQIVKMKNQRLLRLEEIHKEMDQNFVNALQDLNKKQIIELQKARVDYEKAIKDFEKSIITQKKLILENIEPFVKMHVEEILNNFKKEKLINKNG